MVYFSYPPLCDMKASWRQNCCYCCSVAKLCLFFTPWTGANQALLSPTILWSLLRFMFTELVMLFNHLIPCHPFLLVPSILYSKSKRVIGRWAGDQRESRNSKPLSTIPDVTKLSHLG